MNQPALEEFEVAPEQYARYKGDLKKDESILSHLVGWTISISVFVWFELGHGWLSAAAEPLIVAWVVSGALLMPLACVVFNFISNPRASSRDTTDALFGGFLMGVSAPLLIPIGIGWFLKWSVVQIKKLRTLKDPVVSRIKLYEKAEAAYSAELEEVQRQERIRLEAEKRQWREAEWAKQAALLAKQRKREQYW